MATGALHSDHINYLILRYLQEHGHENAATAFYRDWHRPQEFRDPERLPFAPVVKRHALVSVVQDGLRYDELSAKHSAYGPKFLWTAIDPREPYSEEDVVGLENGVGSSRPSSSGKRKGRPPVMRAPDEFPTPAAKRQRRSEGSEGVHINGDREAMEVDALSPEADADEDADAASPDVVDTAEALEIPERYDSMDVNVGMQTDRKAGPKADTLYLNINKPGAKILHTAWNPDSDPKHAKTLLTVGESLCRFYDISEGLDHATQISRMDDPSVPPNSTVTATTWHPLGHTAAYAVDNTRSLPDGRHETSHLLLTYSRNYGTNVLEPGFDLLLPAPLVLCLRYSPDGEYLLVVRTNLKRGLVQLWRTHGADGKAHSPMELQPNEPVAWRMFQHAVLDACWTADDSFLVCGEQGLASAYEVDASVKPVETDGWTAESLAIHGLVEIRSDIAEEKTRWDRLCYAENGNGNVAVFASTESRRLEAQPVPNDYLLRPYMGKSVELDLPGRLTALAFQPDPKQSCLVAASFEEGMFEVYRVRVKPAITDCVVLATVDLVEGPALALAWSPNGSYLAVGGPDVVQIWRREGLETQEAGKDCLPLVTWRPDRAAFGKKHQEQRDAEGEHVDEEEEEEEEEVMVQPSLSWSADGEALCFGLGDELAIINFRPPLQGDEPASKGETDGRASP
ncbi:hypothetical protein LTR08_004254 [Meristemomyces frigidus]|nr:hypothetical protein LTR08_004254 [Meristemomyces frigidus]